MKEYIEYILGGALGLVSYEAVIGVINILPMLPVIK